MEEEENTLKEWIQNSIAEGKVKIDHLAPTVLNIL